MTTEEIKEVLVVLQAKLENAFPDGIPDMLLVYEIVENLNGISLSDLNEFSEFVDKFKNKLFESGTGSDFLKLASYQLEKPSLEDTTEVSAEILPIKVVREEAVAVENAKVTLKGFKPLFIEILNCLEHELLSLKGYFLFQLYNNDNLDYLPLVLHDDKCFYHSVKKKLESTFEEFTCQSIDAFRQDLEDAKNSAGNYAVLLLLSTKINDQKFIDEIKSDLSAIFSLFPDYGFVSIKPTEKIKTSDLIVTNDSESFFEEVEYVTSTFLTNADLSNEEEKLVKSLFKHVTSSPILEYKILKGGKSGSKVLEVKPKMGFNNEITKRYVTKFSKIDQKAKIKLEMQAYSQYIENFSTPLYQSAHYAKTASMEGMKYSYASKDAVQASYSFASILDDSENRFYTTRVDIIEQLFSSDPFQMWMVSVENGTFKVGDLYERFISPDNFYAAVKKVKYLTDEDLKADNLIQIFNSVFEFQLQTKKKVCHGDLHSENFFKDQTGIYLIDFGFTGPLHSLVDHTALECSIKFKHVPSYIDIDLLSEIEAQLTTDESFNPTFQVTSNRQDIVEYFNIINKIRIDSNALCLVPNSKVEYLISLFIMTCRQVQYPDLNQLYALKSAEIIGNRIKQLVTLTPS